MSSLSFTIRIYRFRFISLMRYINKNINYIAICIDNKRCTSKNCDYIKLMKLSRINTTKQTFILCERNKRKNAKTEGPKTCYAQNVI